MRIGVDVGAVRVGVAASDPAGVLASPVTVLRRDTRHGRDLDELVAIVTDREAVEVLVGLPVLLSGRPGRAVDAARAYAGEVAAKVAPIPVRLVDERLSTVSATRAMRAAGRSSRDQKGRVDAAAAAVLLQAALDAERATGEPPGDPVPLEPR